MILGFSLPPIVGTFGELDPGFLKLHPCGGLCLLNSLSSYSPIVL